MRLRQVTVSRRRQSAAAAWAALALAGAPARAQPIPDAPRFEAPIRALQLSDETIRYGVAIAVNGVSAMAGLDTGAMGLRLMPDAPGRAQSRATAKRESFTFGTGSHLEGSVGEARLTIGGVSGPIYTVAKHGVVAMSHSLNMQECVNGIRSTVFLPGEVATPILDKRPNPVGPEVRAKMVQPEDCGDLIRYIAGLPKHIVMNEVHLAPTHNRGYISALQRQL